MNTIVYLKDTRTSSGFIENFVRKTDLTLKRGFLFQKMLAKHGFESNGILIKTRKKFIFSGNFPNADEKTLVILSSAISDSELSKIRQFLGSAKLEILGCSMRDPRISYKSSLHPSLDKKSSIPKWYKENIFELSDITLPGYSCFSHESLRRSFKKLQQDYPGETIRLKFADLFGGFNQKTFIDLGQFTKYTNKNKLIKDELSKKGVVLELNLNFSSTYSLTNFELDGKKICSYGKQHNNRSIYRGTFPLGKKPKVGEMLDRYYSVLEPQIRKNSSNLNRFNFDVVVGKLNNGKKISGVTDLSLRPGFASVLEINILYSKKNYDKGIFIIYSSEKIRRAENSIISEFISHENGIQELANTNFLIILEYHLDKWNFSSLLKLEKRLKRHLSVSTEDNDHKIYELLNDKANIISQLKLKFSFLAL